MKLLRILAIALLAMPAAARCQDICTLSGKVLDMQSQPLNSGDIFILKESDSSVLKKASILKGSFAFEPLIKGEYLLKITAAGFKDKFQLLVLDETKSVIISMEHSTAVLQEVTVTGAKRTFVNRNGNTLVNVDNSPLASVPDAVSLLSKLPAVQVSADGESISVVGKGTPLIYIDNQKMSIEDLKSLPVADIKTIELINDPSAKYEADGRTVILITRKPVRKEGWKAEFGETAAYRKYYLNRSMANVSMRKKKLELKGNFQYNQLKTWEGNAFDFQITGQGIESKYSVTAVTTRPQFIGEAGAFYQINDGDYISFSADARTQNTSFPIYTSSSLRDATHEESVLTSTYNRVPNLYYTSRLNYNNKLKNGNLFAGVQQTSYSSNMKTGIFNNYNNTSQELSQDRVQKTGIHVQAARVDWERSLAGNVMLEMGAAATHAASNGFTDLVSYNSASTTHAVFHYDEKNYASYGQLSGKFSKVGYLAGLRIEDTHVVSDYDDQVTPTSIRKTSTRLFPKAHLTIPLDSTDNIAVKYAKTVVRPDYSNANQTAVYINPYFEWTNNINLGPSVTDEVGATYQHKELSVAITLYSIKGPAYDSFDFNEAESILTRTEINYDQETGAQLSLTIPFKYKIWSSTNTLSGILNSVKDSVAVMGKSMPFAYFHSSNEFRLPANYTFTVSGWAVSKSHRGVYEGPALFAVDTSLTKTFFKNLSCSVRFNNMFRSLNNNYQRFAINDVVADGVFSDNTREFAVALKYSIGKLKESRFQNKDIDDSGNRVR